MSCCLQPTEQDIDEFRAQLKHQNSEQEVRENVTDLRRGGVVIKTKIGNIQVGMPPETIKDSLLQGIAMPNIFVVPSKRYSRQFFMNVAEFEFPAYFNFFVTKKKIKLVCDHEQMKNIRVIFQETLLGPVDFPNPDDEFSEMMPKAMRPDFKKELGHMAVNPFTKEKLVLETLMEFVLFDEANVARLDQDVRIIKVHRYFEIYEGEQLIAKVKDKVKLNMDPYFTTELLRSEKREILEEKGIKESMGDPLKSYLQPLGFKPPDFGITILGASHGFDCKGSTSGYILWVNQRGIMVDPPPFSSQNLHDFGIPPNLIDKVILTHCHADHDSGIFQKILHCNTVELVTTPTILGSFLRKYSALTGLPIQHFRDLFYFRPVTIGSYIDLLGGSFRFFYSYHSIPCIGFEVTFCGRSLYFSGDTYFDPVVLKKLCHDGVFSQERYESLVEVNWSKYDLILHEAGVPPIHTSTSVLKEFPSAIKDKLYLIHIAAKDVPEGVGLKAAKTGLKNTIVLDVNVQVDSSIQMLDLLSSIEFLNQIPLIKARDLIRSCKVEQYDSGQVVIKEGTYGNKFYIIMSGIARISSTNSKSKFSKYAYSGDYFGETSLIYDGKRGADIIAYTQLTLMCISKNDFKWIFGFSTDECSGEPVCLNPENHLLFTKLKNLTMTRKNKTSEFLNRNKCFSSLTESQKNQMNMFITFEKITKDTVLWSRGQPPEYCLFVYQKGSILLKTPPNYTLPVADLEEGHLIGDLPGIITGEAAKSEAVCLHDTEILKVEAADLVSFLQRNPGLKLLFREEYIIY